jgi:hypothetical protein
MLSITVSTSTSRYWDGTFYFFLLRADGSFLPKYTIGALPIEDSVFKDHKKFKKSLQKMLPFSFNCSRRRNKTVDIGTLFKRIVSRDFKACFLCYLIDLTLLVLNQHVHLIVKLHVRIEYFDALNFFCNSTQEFFLTLLIIYTYTEHLLINEKQRNMLCKG